MDARLWHKLKGRLGSNPNRKRFSWPNERMRSLFTAAFLAAIVLFAIDESLSKPPAIGRQHFPARSDLDVDNAPIRTSHANFSMPSGTLTEYWSNFAEISQVN